MRISVIALSCLGAFASLAPQVCENEECATEAGLMSLNHQTQRELATDGKSSSVTLKNHQGTFYTLDLEVGKEHPSKLEVVADTGSISVLVPDCRCVKQSASNGGCWQRGQKCVEGHPTAMNDWFNITFGSGEVDCLLGSEQVKVGDVKADMNGVVMLMEHQYLDFYGSGIFEGILGLGKPQVAAVESGIYSRNRKMAAGLAGFKEKSFFETIGTNRFSMCLVLNAHDNFMTTNGQLTINPPMKPKLLKTYGLVHWALKFNGFSVGEDSSPNDSVVCKGGSGNKFACAMIPDSGTTLLSGPKKGVEAIMDSICDGWSKCKEEAAKTDTTSLASVLRFSSTSKSDILQDLVMGCPDLKELPTLKMHVQGKDGNKESMSLSPFAYVVKTTYESFLAIVEHLPGNTTTKESLMRRAAEHEQSGRKTCTLAFDTMDFSDPTYGDVWVMGLPFFREQVAVYEMGNPDSSVGFVQANSCGNGNAQLVKVPEGVEKQMHEVSGPPRRKKWAKESLI